jgi:hypothetical protein
VRSSPVRRALPWLLIGLLVAAAGVRLLRLPLAWNYWAIDYLSYPLAHRDELSRGHIAWTRLTGLHPGQWSLGMAGLGALGGGVRSAWAVALTLSVGSIAVAGGWLKRFGAGPAAVAVLLLGLSPLQAHYGLELNNYPLYLLGSAVLAVGLDRGLRGDGHRWALAGGLIVLHGHLAGHALVAAGVALAIWRGRKRLIGALLIAEVLAAPVTLAALGARRGDGVFHNERPGLGELIETLSTLWVARFGPATALVAITVAVVWLGGRALRRPETRSAGTVLAALAGAGLVATIAGLWSGAAFVGQTPYWLQPSWALLCLAALGTTGLSRRQAVVAALLLSVWAGPASQRTLKPTAGSDPTVGVIEPPNWRAPSLEAPRHPVDGLAPGPAWAAPGFPANLQNREPSVPASWWRAAPIPGREGPRVRTLPAPSADVLRQALHDDPPDVLVWIWEPTFLNDDPRGHDPLFSALDPADIGDVRPVEEPYPGFCRDWIAGRACFLNRASLRGGEFESELLAALQRWTSEGLSVDLVFASLDSAQVPPDPRRARLAVEAMGQTWTDRFVGLTWVASIRGR